MREVAKGTIIYAGNFELPDKNAAAHRVTNNGKIFRALGYRVVFLGAVRDEAFSGVRESSYDPDVFEEAYPVGTRAWVKHIFDASNIRAVADKCDDVKLVILYNAPYATVKSVKKAFAGTSVTVAYDCTEWNPSAEGSLPKRLYKKLDEKRVRTRLARLCDDIIVISKRMERAYSGANVLRLPPLVDVDEAIWKQEREAHPGTFGFCFAAGSVANKERPDAVVEGFLLIGDPDARLRVVGLTEAEFASAYPSLAEKAASDGRVVFRGLVSHAEAVRIVLSCDCYVFIRENTTRNEAGFPTKFAEAYTCGVPIVTTDVSDVADYITSPDKGFIVAGTDANAVEAGMRESLSRRAKTEKELVLSFDYRNHISETEKWFREAER